MANVCGIDRFLRITVGAALVALSFVGPFTEVLFPWGLIGIVPLVTGLIGWCPAYTLFGFKSCSKASQ
jgi:hypothetical protein